jgi:cation transport ATPase
VQVDGRRVTVGKMAWMVENKVQGINDEVHGAVTRLEEQAKTAVVAAIDLQVGRRHFLRIILP